MPPRVAKKCAVSKRRVSTRSASSQNVDVGPPPCADSPATEVEEAISGKTYSSLRKSQTEESDPIMIGESEMECSSAKEGESSRPDPVVRARPAKKRAVAKKRATVAVARDEFEQKDGLLLEKGTEVDKSEVLEEEKDCIGGEKLMDEVLEANAGEEIEMDGEGENMVEGGEGIIENIGGVKEIEEEAVKEEIKDEEDKNGYTEIEEPLNGGETEEPVEEKEPIAIEEEMQEEPVEEKPVQEMEPIVEEELEEDQEPIEKEMMDEGGLVEEGPVDEEEPVEEELMDKEEPIEEELVESEEESEVEEEEEAEGEEEVEGEEEELLEEEPIEEDEEKEEEEAEGEEEVEGEEEELLEEEPIEEDEEKEVEEEYKEGEEEEEYEEGEEEEEEEEPVEEEVGEGDGKEEYTPAKCNEENRDVAFEDVQPASIDRGGEIDDQGLGDMPDPTMCTKDLLANSKVKETQIFISQLEKTVVEEDIAQVFASFGEILSVRVIRHSLTQKSKGYAFLQYSTAEAVKKALSQLKDGAKIKGKAVHISASNQEDCTLFVGNICKSWSKDQVLDALKGLGVEGIEQIALPEDPKVEGKIKGFAFIEFYTHIDARTALNLLCKPDAVLGCDFSAKVSFAQFPVSHSEEELAKGKTVYLEPLPTSWDGKKIEEICKEYGAIEQIKLIRRKGYRRKDFAFVEFISRDSALTCVVGLNKAVVGHGNIKLSASIAKPYFRKIGTKFIMRGNFKVTKNKEHMEKKETKLSNENAEKKEVKIIEVSGETKRKRKKQKSKEVIAHKSKALSPQKAIKKKKKMQKNFPDIKTPKEAPHRHVSKKILNKDAPVPVHPKGSKKRPFKEAPESSKRPSKGKKIKHERGMRGAPDPHQSRTKKSKPFKGNAQRQKERPIVNNERAFKRSYNDRHGDYQSHVSPIDRGLSVKYGYVPPPYASSIHEHPYSNVAYVPSRREPPYTSRTDQPYAYAAGSYHPHRSDLAPHAGYVQPTHHAPHSRHVYEPSAPAPAPYGGGYNRAIVYTREPPIPLPSHPGYVTYPRYQHTSYPYPAGEPYSADYPPRRSYY